jgi:hypothetical protein
MDLPEPDAVDAPGFRPVGLLEDVPERLDLARPVTNFLDEDPEVHGLDTHPRVRCSQEGSKSVSSEPELSDEL